MKKACCSNVKDPQNRSYKDCVCGGHFSRAKNSKKKKNRRVKLKYKEFGNGDGSF